MHFFSSNTVILINAQQIKTVTGHGTKIDRIPQHPHRQILPRRNHPGWTISICHRMRRRCVVHALSLIIVGTHDSWLTSCKISVNFAKKRKNGPKMNLRTRPAMKDRPLQFGVNFNPDCTRYNQALLWKNGSWYFYFSLLWCIHSKLVQHLSW